MNTRKASKRTLDDTLAMVAFALLFFLAAAQTALSKEAMVAQALKSDIEALVAETLVHEGVAEPVKALISNMDAQVLFESAEPFDITMENFAKDTNQKRWKGELVALKGDTELKRLALEGRFDTRKMDTKVSVPVLVRRVSQGEMIAQSDIDWVELPARRVRKDVITDAKDLIGKTPRRVISENRAIRLSEIESPQIIKKGDLVQMNYATPYMEIRTVGLALEDGGAGDMVKVRNNTSNIVIQATITGQGTVQVVDPVQLSYNSRM